MAKKDNRNKFLIFAIAAILVAFIAYFIGTQTTSKPKEKISFEILSVGTDTPCISAYATTDVNWPPDLIIHVDIPENYEWKYPSGQVDYGCLPPYYGCQMIIDGRESKVIWSVNLETGLQSGFCTSENYEIHSDTAIDRRYTHKGSLCCDNVCKTIEIPSAIC